METPRNGCAVTCWPLLPGELLAFLFLVYFFVLCMCCICVHACFLGISTHVYTCMHVCAQVKAYHLPLDLSKTHFHYLYSGVSMKVSYKQFMIANMIARFIIY